MRRYALVLVGTFALAQPAWALFGVGELETQVKALQQRVDAIDARLVKIEAALQDNQQMLNLLKEVETLKAELATLRGQAEVQVHQLDTLGKRQNDLYADLDQRIADLAKAAQPAPADGTPAAEPAAAGTSPQTGSMEESRSYEAALALFRAANYPGAIAGFNGFLKVYPGSTLASNAQYWIGESYYGLHEYSQALKSFQDVVSLPRSGKKADATLMIGNCHLAMGNASEAKEAFQKVVSDFPTSPLGDKAREKLSRLN